MIFKNKIKQEKDDDIKLKYVIPGSIWEEEGKPLPPISFWQSHFTYIFPACDTGRRINFQGAGNEISKPFQPWYLYVYIYIYIEIMDVSEQFPDIYATFSRALGFFSLDFLRSGYFRKGGKSTWKIR